MDRDHIAPANDPSEARGPSDSPAETDELLMERIRADDASAFAMLFDRHWALMVVVAERILLRRDAAKDVAQEAFVQLWRRRAEWTPGGSARAYLWRSTRNLALNEQRRLRLRAGWSERNAREVPEPSGARGPAEVFAGEALRKEVEEAIRSLPPRRREVFMLARFKGLSYDEIAEAMGISPQTVANTMSAALAALRESLAELRSSM